MSDSQIAQIPARAYQETAHRKSPGIRCICEPQILFKLLGDGLHAHLQSNAVLVSFSARFWVKVVQSSTMREVEFIEDNSFINSSRYVIDLCM